MKPTTEAEPILEVKDLRVDFPAGRRVSSVLRGIDLSLARGEVLGLVGESGSGKSVLARTLVRLESPGKIVAGSIILDGRELTGESPQYLDQIRGKKISMVLQNPKSAMDPVFTMGGQFREVFSVVPGARRRGRKKRIMKQVQDLLLSVGVASPEERCRQYPHQWSRGMLQRAQLLMGFAPMPKVVILDEVTSALDPTITVQILELIRRLKERHGTGVIFITHDLSVASKLCDTVAVMHKGDIVETGNTREIIDRPSQPYTKRLVSGIFGTAANRGETTDTATIISLRNLTVRYPLKSGSLFFRRHFNAVQRVSLDIREKEFFCLIGESGSGKTTLMNSILGFYPYQEGTLIYNGHPITRCNDAVHQRLRTRAQVVFQDPVSSLSPYLTLGQSIVEPVHTGLQREKERIARHLAKEVGLPPALLRKHPAQVSVGQNQRACIARALSSMPDLLFLDEPLSALDWINQKEMIRLLCRLKSQHGLTCFMITHDLGLVKDIGTNVAVMYLGRIVEKAPVGSFFAAPRHPYSQALLSNALKPGLWHAPPIILEGEIASPHHPPSGCAFHPRCPKRQLICEKKEPLKKQGADGHETCCHFA